MSKHLAERVKRIKPSPTLTISARASEMKSQGRDVISLSTGEPDFDTPDHIKQAAKLAMTEGKTKYTPIDGIPALKQAICEKFHNDNKIEYEPNQILVSNGAKQSVFNCVMALVNNGDEVVIPAPYWVSYPDIVLVAGGLPVIIETTRKQSFKITPADLKQALNEKTRLVFLNSPSNPTGVAYTMEELKKLADVLLDFPDVFIVSDDIYEHIYWGKSAFANIVMACPELKERTIVINGVSKAYSMTGWRIGYSASCVELSLAMKRLQSQSTSNPCSISQYAATAALVESQDCVDDMTRVFKSRHDKALAKLQKLEGIDCEATDGTFYMFPNVQAIIDSRDDLQTDYDFVEKFLVDYEVATVPGSAFGAPGHIRLSIATSLEQIEKGLMRLEQFIS